MHILVNGREGIKNKLTVVHVKWRGFNPLIVQKCNIICGSRSSKNFRETKNVAKIFAKTKNLMKFAVIPHPWCLRCNFFFT
jgi:hypothetical protein